MRVGSEGIVSWWGAGGCGAGDEKLEGVRFAAAYMGNGCAFGINSHIRLQWKRGLAVHHTIRITESYETLKRALEQV